MAERVEVNLIVKAIAEGFDRVAAEQRKAGAGAEEHEKKISSLGQRLGKLTTIISGVTAGLVGFAATFKKAFDLARAGAAIDQTKESFDRLVTSLGQGPELLDELRQAARGTVDDMTLMSSVMTLVAGAGPNLAAALLKQTPALLEIAKAANKLNPALGDTAFFFESITTGIKRAQPLILDNLGLTIKVGAANKAMAEKLGKSVDALTAEEKAMAILNDTMRAGGVIIDQVGGSTEALTDPFDQLSAQIKNLTDDAKSWLANGLLPWFEILKGLEPVLEDHHANVLKNAESYNEYRIEMERAAEAAGKIAITQEELEQRSEILGRDLSGLKDFFIILSASEREAALKTTALTDEFIDAHKQVRGLEGAVKLTGIAFKNMGAAATAGFTEIDLAIGSSIEKTIDQLIFVAGGGAEIAAVVEEITRAVETGKIMPDDAIPLYERAQRLTLEIQENTELITHKEAIKTAKEWGIELETPVSQVETIRGDLAGLTSGEHVIRVRIEVEGGDGLDIGGGGSGGGGGGGRGDGGLSSSQREERDRRNEEGFASGLADSIRDMIASGGGYVGGGP